MKEIQNYNAPKYAGGAYSELESGIYETKDGGDTLYVTSLSFVQEPELEEGNSADCISQYPLEDLLDKFNCHISDFYEPLNTADSTTCYLEFAAFRLEDAAQLRSVIGKHVCNKAVDGRVKLVIE